MYISKDRKPHPSHDNAVSKGPIYPRTDQEGNLIYYRYGRGGKLVAASEKEIEEAGQLRRELEKDEFLSKLRGTKTERECVHRVFYDVSGFLYCFRYCLACGEIIDAI